MTDYYTGYSFRPIQNWPRAMTSKREYSRFDSTYSQTLELLTRELRAINAHSVVIQLALKERDIRRDGLPRADSNPSHPGVIVSFETKGRAVSMPCDRFVKWTDNLRAIALSLEALRKVDRYGVTQSGEQYVGWAQLPAPNDNDIKTLEDAILFVMAKLPATEGMNGSVTQDGILRDASVLQRAYRALARILHPDNGGETVQFQKLQQAAEFLKRHHGLR